jgi:ABC-type multidrug transport system fused ATPase/permease subunit
MTTEFTTLQVHVLTILTLLGIVFLPWLIGKVTNIFIGDQDETPGETWGFGLFITTFVVGVVFFFYFTYTIIYTCYIINYNN